MDQRFGCSSSQEVDPDYAKKLREHHFDVQPTLYQKVAYNGEMISSLTMHAF
jgi:hypothetical protein